MNAQYPDTLTPNSSRYKSQELYSESNMDNAPPVKMDMAQERKTISVWSRDDLEDKYLRLMEDHLVLKKHARLQEIKIKKMSTKLLKLTSDAKKNGDLTPKIDDTEDLLRKNSILESQNGLLKDKLKLLQSQLVAQGRKPTAYDNVPGRTKMGSLERVNSAQNTSRKNIRIIKPRGEMYPLSPRKDDAYEGGQSNAELNKIIDNLKYELHRAQLEKEELSKKAYWKDNDNIDQRANVKDNLDLIRLRRDLDDKKIQINEMHSKYEDLKIKQQHLEKSNSEMADEIDRLNSRLRSTDDYAGTAEGQIRNMGVLKKRVNDLEIINNDFKKEILLLKEANNKLTNDAFNTERERDWREKEMNYRAKIAQLELTLKRDVGEKNGVMNRLESERDKFDTAEKEMSSLRLRNYELQSKIDELTEKLKFFSKEASLNPQEIEEALMIIQHKRNMAHAQSTPELDFLEKVDKKKDQDLVRRLQECEMNHAETIQELEKTRSLLRTQYKITNDYRQESEKISLRLEELKKDYEDRLNEYARLLDIRAGRIQKLEAQLKDIAYGTRNTQIETLLEPDMEPLEPEILERGENILEIHIGRVCLTQLAIESIKDKEPFLFGTWDFYDFETQATGVLRGTSSDFDIKAEYLVKIDDFFLNYLYKNTFSFELHQATGAEYVTLAACQLSCRDLFDKTAQESKINKGMGFKYNCKAKLVGIRENTMDINFGVVEYWIRLKYPMDQVIRQYREKLKAEGYIMGNEMAMNEVNRPIESMNELVIQIIRCGGLKSRQKHLQPSAYIAYTFYNHNDHTTVTIPSSNTPEFHDIRRFPVQMNVDLHQYLKSQSLQVYVFDELDPDESVYLGKASIPMIQLCHNKNISGSFELYDPQNLSNGTLEIEVRWQHSYLHSDTSFDNFIRDVTLLPGEEKMTKDTTDSPVKEVPHNETNHAKENENLPKKKERKKKLVEQNPDENRMMSPPTVPVIKPTKRTRTSSGPERSLTESLKDKTVLENLIMPDTELPVRSPSNASEVVEEDQIEAITSRDKNKMVDQNLDKMAKKLEPSETKADDESVTADITDKSEKKKKSKKDKNKSLGEEKDKNDTEKDKKDKNKDKEKESNDKDKGKEKEKNKSKEKEKNKNSDKIKENDKNKEKEKDKKTNKEKDKSNDKEKEKEKDKEIKPDLGKANIRSENDDVVVDKKVKKPTAKSEQNPDEIVVEVISVELEEKAEILRDDNVKFLFVAYRIPGISSEMTETISLKKPQPNQENKKMNYNFKKTFDVSYNKNYMIRQHIATMLTEDSNKHIVFSLVQEPGEDSDDDCEDIGMAKVNVEEMLNNERNLENERIPIYSARNQSTIMAYITVSIKMLGVLKAIKKELKKA